MKPDRTEGIALLCLGAGWLSSGNGARHPSLTTRTSSAICPARGIGAAIIAPAANTECMNLHLDEITTQIAQGSIAGLICDGAGWHQSNGELIVPANIVLLPLPPYSPELNSMENVWDYLRANKFSACVWDIYDEILAACADAWNWFTTDPERIGSIGARDWARAIAFDRGRSARIHPTTR
jgi:hypothetical protein